MANKKGKNTDPASSFAESTAQLEGIVKLLENEETSLEDAMAAFEEGIKITREVQQMLQDAEQKVAVLLEEDGEMVLEELDEDSGTE